MRFPHGRSTSKASLKLANDRRSPHTAYLTYVSLQPITAVQEDVRVRRPPSFAVGCPWAVQGFDLEAPGQPAQDPALQSQPQRRGGFAAGGQHPAQEATRLAGAVAGQRYDGVLTRGFASAVEPAMPSGHDTPTPLLDPAPAPRPARTARPRAARNAEILVLRHEIAVLHLRTQAFSDQPGSTPTAKKFRHGGFRMRPTAYRRNARSLRDRQAFEGVRIQAGALFAAGHTQAQVARQLGVARQNVSRWHAQWQAGGPEALRSAGPTGPDPRLSEEQLHLIDQALREGARAHGFPTDHWTLERITTVIERLTGVGYHRGHVWKPTACTTACCPPVTSTRETQ
jgi:transposase